MRLWPRKDVPPEPIEHSIEEPIRREHTHRHEVTHRVRYDPKPIPHQYNLEAVSLDGRIYRFVAQSLWGTDGEFHSIDLGQVYATFGEKPIQLRLTFHYKTDRL